MQVIRHYNKTILLSVLTVILSLYKIGDVHKVEQLFPYIDKVVHFLMYFAITIAFLLERYIRTRRMGKKVCNYSAQS